VWVLARINRAPSVIDAKTDDKVEKFVLLSNSHDGSLAVRIGLTPVRVVCRNTLAIAHGHEGSSLLRIRHRANIADNLAAVREVINLADQRFEATAEQYRKLAARDIDSADLRRYVDLVFTSPSIDDSAPPAHDRIFRQVERLFEEGRGASAISPSYWRAYNALNEYLGYVRGRSQDTRLDSLWFGNGAELNRRALHVALQMAA
jgi:phage/plasmid-like protein (TIGR03299 family)